MPAVQPIVATVAPRYVLAATALDVVRSGAGDDDVSTSGSVEPVSTSRADDGRAPPTTLRAGFTRDRRMEAHYSHGDERYEGT